jgi:hypothetical protein
MAVNTSHITHHTARRLASEASSLAANTWRVLRFETLTERSVATTSKLLELFPSLNEEAMTAGARRLKRIPPASALARGAKGAVTAVFADAVVSRWAATLTADANQVLPEALPT